MPEEITFGYLCEVCGKNEAMSFSWVINRKPEWGSKLRLTCMCTSKSESYYAEFRRFFQSPKETVGWLSHLQEKPWYNSQAMMSALVRLAQYE